MPWKKIKQRLVRVGLDDVVKMLRDEGYTTSKTESGKAIELVSPEGYAEYWCTKLCFEKAKRSLK